MTPPPMLNRRDYRLADTVARDLAYLMDEWRPSLDVDELRRTTSPMLRRLLVEGDYGRAWRLVGFDGEPSISAPSLKAMLGGLDRSKVNVAWAPPSETIRETFNLHDESHVHIKVARDAAKGSVAVLVVGWHSGTAAVLYVEPPPPAIANPVDGAAVSQDVQTKLGRRVVRGSPLTAYLSAPAVLAGDLEISRRDIIKYVANKLGGVHSDESRDGEEGARFTILDQPLGEFEAPAGNRTNLVYAELLSIAEFLAASSDADKYRRAFAKIESPS